MVGLFINTLPVRVQISAGTAFLSWLKALQEQQIELRQYEYSELAKVQSWSEVPQGLPLFESIVVFENYPMEALALDGRQGLTLLGADAVIRNNLPFTVRAVPGTRLLLQILYDPGRFDRADIESVLRGFEMLLTKIASGSDLNLGELTQSMSETDRKHRLVKEREFKEARSRRLKDIKRRAVQGPAETRVNDA